MNTLSVLHALLYFFLRLESCPQSTLDLILWVVSLNQAPRFQVMVRIICLVDRIIFHNIYVSTAAIFSFDVSLVHITIFFWTLSHRQVPRFWVLDRIVPWRADRIIFHQLYVLSPSILSSNRHQHVTCPQNHTLSDSKSSPSPTIWSFGHSWSLTCR